jgi:hypothetical protein
MTLVGTKNARGPDGRVWSVSREWMPRSPRWPGVGLKRIRNSTNVLPESIPDLGSGCLDLDSISAILVGLAIVLVLVLIWLFVLPALIFVADLALIVVIAAAGVAARVLFRRPWDVVAQTAGPPAERLELPVVGWRASGEYVDEVAYRIESTGSPLPR